MSKQLKLTRPPLDETKKAFLEWKRLEKIQDNGRINSQKQLNAEKRKNTRLNSILRQLSHKNIDWHGVPKPKPLPEIYNVKQFEYEKPRELHCLVLDEDITHAKSAKYLIERATHELYMPCICEITDDVASFVAMIMRGTKKDRKEFNLLFIPMELTHLFGPHLMRSLFEFGMEIPVVLCTDKKLTQSKQQILDSAHLRITLNRDELESRTSRATRKPWTSYPLPWEKSKLAMLISSWWKPTLERLERHRNKRDQLKALRRKKQGKRPTKNDANVLFGVTVDKKEEEQSEDEDDNGETALNPFNRKSFSVSSRKLIEQKMAPGQAVPTAADLMKRSASFVMLYPRINGLGVNGTIRTYASKQYDLSGSIAPALKFRWEEEMEHQLRDLDPLEMAKLDSHKQVYHNKNKKVSMGKKMMKHLKASKSKIQQAHVKRLQQKSFLIQSRKITKLLPIYGGHNSLDGVGLRHVKKQKENRTKDAIAEYNKMKTINNTCGLQPVHPIKGYAVSWDFQ
jgi:hypothetical protein